MLAGDLIVRVRKRIWRCYDENGVEPRKTGRFMAVQGKT